MSRNRNEQFLHFPECFQKTCAADTEKNQGLFGKGLTSNLFTKRSRPWGGRAFEDSLRNRENAGYQNFLLPLCFYPIKYKSHHPSKHECVLSKPFY